MGNLPKEQETVALPVNSVTDTALNLNPNGTPSLMGNLPKGQESVAPPVNSVTDTALNLNPDGTPITYRTAKSGPNRDHWQNATLNFNPTEWLDLYNHSDPKTISAQKGTERLERPADRDEDRPLRNRKRDYPECNVRKRQEVGRIKKPHLVTRAHQKAPKTG
jgi:hypothetical protein